MVTKAATVQHRSRRDAIQWPGVGVKRIILRLRRGHRDAGRVTTIGIPTWLHRCNHSGWPPTARRPRLCPPLRSHQPPAHQESASTSFWKRRRMRYHLSSDITYAFKSRKQLVIQPVTKGSGETAEACHAER